MPAQKETSKPFWKSSTFWINTAGIVAVGLEVAVNVPGIDPEYVALAVAVLNILNRWRVKPNAVKKLTVK